jgi:hypothetical protein
MRARRLHLDVERREPVVEQVLRVERLAVVAAAAVVRLNHQADRS